MTPEITATLDRTKTRNLPKIGNKKFLHQLEGYEKALEDIKMFDAHLIHFRKLFNCPECSEPLQPIRSRQMMEIKGKCLNCATKWKFKITIEESK
ncbi:MAG: hypothetical protein ACFE95_13445 [Candidatus Hodarchaeota archaeon]